MALQYALGDITTVTAGNVVASSGDMILVAVREAIATPATPSGTGLTAFDLIALTSGNANNGADTARVAWYRTKATSAFNDTLAFANNAFGYVVYVESGLVTTGSNGADSIVQACGLFAAPSGLTETITFGSASGAGNRLIAAHIGFQDIGTVLPSTAKTNWTTDGEDYDAGTDLFSVAQSRASGSDTSAEITFTVVAQIYHGVALELAVEPEPPAGGLLQQGAGGYVGQWPFGLVA